MEVHKYSVNAKSQANVNAKNFAEGLRSRRERCWGYISDYVFRS